MMSGFFSICTAKVRNGQSSLLWRMHILCSVSHRPVMQIAHPQADQLPNTKRGEVLLWPLQMCFTLTPLEKAERDPEQRRPERGSLRCPAHVCSATASQKVWCGTKQCKSNKMKGLSRHFVIQENFCKPELMVLENEVTFSSKWHFILVGIFQHFLSEHPILLKRC